ncbi:MAG: GDP-mannose 4,6-dehydratase [Dehalococcoidia bacterium]|jgi:UDP-glucose 4-epimerase|nr:GDP-mannose 4,6-dehydratase [Dehalococcoidia bacterium]|tara:strand:+ start:5624 stop:6553 length:930 start_codon:yes stop_codon:yes gene_type:complete
MANENTALVTGGAGFIGSHLVDELLNSGRRVIVVDDLSSGQLKNINSNCVFMHGDITSDALDSIFEKEKPSLVFHLAAQSSVAISSDKPLLDASTNILGTLKIAENCYKHGVKKLIYSSTGGAIYGEPPELPVDESTAPRPISNYGVSKFQGEQFIELYHKLHNVNYCILRYANVYGPRQDGNGEAGVIPIFATLIQDGKQPTIFGTGEQKRDFISVHDVVRANMLAISNGKNSTYNIGSSVMYSVNQIYDLIKDHYGFTKEALTGAPRTGDVFEISLDYAKAKKELEWEPEIDFENGLQETLQYIQTH